MCWAWLILFVCIVQRDEELIGARHPAIFSDAPQPLARFKIPAGFLLIPVGPLAS
jgi:hypothetical protein